LSQIHADFGILCEFAGWATFFGYFVNFEISLFSYSAAAAAFSLFAAMLLSVWRNRVRGSLLTITCIASAGWAVALAYFSTQADVSLANILLTELVFDCIWLIFLSSLLSGAVVVESNWLVRRGGVALGVGLLFFALLLEFAGLKQLLPNALGQIFVMGSIATSLYALVGIEQLYRNARPTQRNGLKFLCLGLAGIFAFDLFLYTNAVVDGQIRAIFWNSRGFVVALCVPLIIISVKRISSWQRGIFASRQIVFYTTTLFAAGIYLILISVAGYLIRTLGIGWSETLQLVFISATVLGFFALILSERLRARVRVFVVKHFFETKYDYRAEWLRLIHTLTTEEDNLPLKKRSIKALAQIVDSPAGNLWMRPDDGSTYLAVAAWDMPSLSASIATESQLAIFMREKAWVIDLADVLNNAKMYRPLTADDVPSDLENAAFLVPISHEAELLGFVSLSKPKTPVTLNFEDYDLLKTAGQQIASYLAQEESTERLAENRQFEAFNRFTAFVMHDLKNLIAQQSLMVKNASKHKGNPEFFEDAMATIENSVARMNKLLSQLKSGDTSGPRERVGLSEALSEAIEKTQGGVPQPSFENKGDSLYANIDRERFTAVVAHLIRNAQEATSSDGFVKVRLMEHDGQAVISITDDGCGMAADFIRNRLFRPFDSTKGSKGMGIGAYQARTFVTDSGGVLNVESETGQGTQVLIRLPIAD